jgi:hypothetical protein
VDALVENEGLELIDDMVMLEVEIPVDDMVMLEVLYEIPELIDDDMVILEVLQESCVNASVEEEEEHLLPGNNPAFVKELPLPIFDVVVVEHTLHPILEVHHSFFVVEVPE